MTESQRQTVPRLRADELPTALAFLSFQRECVIKKLDGLNEEQARRRLVPTDTTLLGLVTHLTNSERFWFGYHVAGGSGATIDREFGMVVPADRTIAELIGEYRVAIADSDAIVRDVGDPDAAIARPVDGQDLPLRWVIAHVTSETARHAGHADILRELIDGVTGR